MRRMLFRVIVYAMALTLTLRLLSLIRLPGPPGTGGVPLLEVGPHGPFLYINLFIESGRIEILVALVFAIMSTLLPPLLAVLFGQYYLRHPITAYVIGNAALFWLVAQISAQFGSPFIAPDPAFLWLTIDSVVFTVVVIALDVLLGLHRPTTRPRRTGGLWSLIERMPLIQRNRFVDNYRMYEVWNVALSFGVQMAADRMPVARARSIAGRLMGNPDAAAHSPVPVQVRLMLESLGPTYVKLGQLASSRRGLLPAGWGMELSRLQSAVPPFPWTDAARTIRAELGDRAAAILGSAETVPLAAASLAQVHRARLDGAGVVVKVQRPDIRAKVRADLCVTAEVAEVAERRFAVARQLDLQGVVEEFASGVIEELDYTNEAYNARRLGDVLASVEGVGVPMVHSEMTTGRVLVMDYVDGVKVTEVQHLPPTLDREVIARRLVRSFIKQIMLDGFFHADPHPGNVFVSPASGQLTFLDLGLMGRLRPEQRLDLLGIVWSLHARDHGLFATVSRRLLRPTGPVDEASVHEALERVYQRTWVYGQGSFGDVLAELLGILARHSLRIRADLTLAFKALTQAEELLTAVAPGMNLVSVAVEEGEQLVRDMAIGGFDEAWRAGLRQNSAELLRQAAQRGHLVLPILAAARDHLSSPQRNARRWERSRKAPRSASGTVTTGGSGRAAGALLLSGLAVLTGLCVLALYLRPSERLGDLEVLALAVPALVATYVILTLHSWHRQDRADGLEDSRSGPAFPNSR